MLTPGYGGGPAPAGAVLTFGGQKLTFAPETIADTINRIHEVRLILSEFSNKTPGEFARQPAAADSVSIQSTDQLRQSADSALNRVRDMLAQLDDAEANLRANGASYMTTDQGALNT